MKSLFKTVSIIIIFSVITRIIGFLFRIYISRTIGAESLGEYQVSFSIFMVLLTIISSGLPFVISRITASLESKHDKKSQDRLITAGLVISIVLSFLLCILVVIFIPVLKKIFADDKCIKLLLILLPALVFSSVYSTIRGNFWGKDNYLLLCATELFEQIARVIIFIIMVQGMLSFTDGATISALSMTGACILSSILVIILYFAKGGKLRKNKDKTIYKELLKKSTPITGVRIVSSLIQPLIALVIPLRLMSAGYSSTEALSLYGIVMGMTLPFLFIPSTVIGSLSTALVPDLSIALAQNNNNYIQKRIVSALKFTIFVSIIFIPLYIGAGSVIGEFFYDNQLSGLMLAKASWIILPLGLTNITSSILNSLGYELKSMRNYILGGIILIISIWFLPKVMGIDALIFGFGSLFSITSIFNLLMLKKITSTKFEIKKFTLLCVAFIIPCASITSLVCNLLVNVTTKFLALAVSCTLGTIFFILLCAIFNLIEIKTIICWVKDNVKLNKKHKRKLKQKKVAN